MFDPCGFDRILTMEIKNILIVTDAPSPYKMEFLKMVESYYHLHILFLDTMLKDRDPRWFAKFDQFSTVVLPKNILSRIHYGLTMDISNYDLFWNMNYTNPISWILAHRFRRHHKPILMHADGGIYKDRGWIMNQLIHHLLDLNDYFTSSGSMNDMYYQRYGIGKDRIFRYRFSSIRENEICGKPRESIHSPIRLLSVGQPIDRKGFDVLLNALVPFAKTNRFQLTIVGGLPNETCAKILEKHEELSKIVEFVPFVGKQELTDYYQLADYFVFPTREDIWGLVINEALAYGLPIISTNQCAAMVEIKQHYDIGEIVNADDVGELSKALQELIDDQTYASKSNNALLAAKNYTIEATVEDYLTIFKRIGDMRNESNR